MIAQKPTEPPPQPHPVGQQALRQQRLQLFNPDINHAGARIIAGQDVAGKPKTHLVSACAHLRFVAGQRPDSYQPRATPWVHRPTDIVLQAKESNTTPFSGKEVMATFPSAGASWRDWCATSTARSNIIAPGHSKKSIESCYRNTMWSSMKNTFGTDAEWLAGRW